MFKRRFLLMNKYEIMLIIDLVIDMVMVNEIVELVFDKKNINKVVKLENFILVYLINKLLKV